MAIKLREEFVGKRFLCTKNGGKSKNFSEWDWKAGFVRAVSQSHPSPKSKDFQVLVEFDDCPWQKREWIRPNSANFQAFLVEKTLVWATRPEQAPPTSSKGKKTLCPALSFVSVVDRVGVKSSKVCPVEFLVDRWLDFQEEQRLTAHREDKPLGACEKEEAAAVRWWTEYQAGQSILLTTPTVLVGYRVQVYRSEGTTQWYTAVIRQYNSATKELCLLDDTVLEEHNENPALIEIRPLGSGVIDSILKGTEIRSTSRRCTAAKEKGKEAAAGAPPTGQTTPANSRTAAKAATPASSQRVSVVRSTRRPKSLESSSPATPPPQSAPTAGKTGQTQEDGSESLSQVNKRELRKRKADTQEHCGECEPLTGPTATGATASPPQPGESSPLLASAGSSAARPVQGALSPPGTSTTQTTSPASRTPSAPATTASPAAPKAAKAPRRDRKAKEGKVRSSLSSAKPPNSRPSKACAKEEASAKGGQTPVSKPPSSGNRRSSSGVSQAKKKGSTLQKVHSNSSSVSPVCPAPSTTPSPLVNSASNRHIEVRSQPIIVPPASRVSGEISRVPAGLPSATTAKSTPSRAARSEACTSVSPDAPSPRATANPDTPALSKLPSTENVDNGSTSGYSSTADNLSPRHDKMNGAAPERPSQDPSAPSAPLLVTGGPSNASTSSAAMTLPVTTTAKKSVSTLDHVNGQTNAANSRGECAPQGSASGPFLPAGVPPVKANNHGQIRPSSSASSSKASTNSGPPSRATECSPPLSLGSRGPGSTTQVHVYRDPELMKKDEVRHKHHAASVPPPPVARDLPPKTGPGSGVPSAGPSPAPFPPSAMAAASLPHHMQLQQALLLQQAAAMRFSPAGSAGIPGMMAAAAASGALPPFDSSLHMIQQQQQHQQQLAMFYANLASASHIETLLQQHKMAGLSLPPLPPVPLPAAPGGPPGSAAAAAMAAQYACMVPPYPAADQQFLADCRQREIAKAEKEKKSKERQDKEKQDKERERLEKAKLEKEKQEKEKRESERGVKAAVNHHFNESLRRASEKEKVKTTDKKPGASISGGTSGMSSKSAGATPEGQPVDGRDTSKGPSVHGGPAQVNHASATGTASPSQGADKQKMSIYGFQPHSQAPTFISPDKLQQHLIKSEKDSREVSATPMHPLNLQQHAGRSESVIQQPPALTRQNGNASKGKSTKAKSSASASPLLPATVAAASPHPQKHALDMAVERRLTPCVSVAATSVHPVNDGLVPNPRYSRGKPPGASASAITLTTSKNISALEKMSPQQSLANSDRSQPNDGSRLTPSSTSLPASLGPKQGPPISAAFPGWQATTTAAPSPAISSAPPAQPNMVMHSFRSFVETAVTEAFFRDIEKEKEGNGGMSGASGSVPLSGPSVPPSSAAELKQSSCQQGSPLPPAHLPSQPVALPSAAPVQSAPSDSDIPRVVNGMTAMDTDSDTLSAPSPGLSSSAAENRQPSPALAASSSSVPTSKYYHKKAWLQQYSNEDSNQSAAGTSAKGKSASASTLFNGSSSAAGRFEMSSSQASSDQDSDQESRPSPPKRKKAQGKSNDAKRPKPSSAKKRNSQDPAVSGKGDEASSAPQRAPRPAKKKLQPVPYLQDGDCTERAPRLKKCRECKASHNKGARLSNIFCRFFYFRRLKVNSKGTVCTAGFSEPSDAKEEDLVWWEPGKAQCSLDVLTARYIIANVGDEFCKLVEEEIQCGKLQNPGQVLAWKRAVQGVREMCDVCCTTLFNMHWTCHNCGFAVCLDCYKEKREEVKAVVDQEAPSGEAGPLAVQGPTQQLQRKWLTCSVNRSAHDSVKLMLTQIIPKDTLVRLCEAVHQIRRKHFIKSKYPCSANDSIERSPPAKTNGVSQLLLKAVNQSISDSLAEDTVSRALPMSLGSSGAPLPSGSAPLSASGLDTSSLQSYSDDPLSLLADVAFLEGKHQSAAATTSSSTALMPSDRHQSILAAYSANKPAAPVAAMGGMQSAPETARSNSVVSSEGELTMDVDRQPDEGTADGKSEKAKVTTAECSSGDKKGSGSVKATSAAAPTRSSAGPPITSLDDFIQTVVESSLTDAFSAPSSPPPAGSAPQYSHYQPRSGAFMKGRDQPVPLCQLEKTLLLYPGVPHSWLCEGRLLRLHDSKHSSNITLFNQRWKLGLPVVVSNVTKAMNAELWHPSRFSQDFGHITHDLVNCRSGAVLPNQHLRDFWDGFENTSARMIDKAHGGEPILLKLKDWPSTEDFSELMPDRFKDLMDALPLPGYTQRKSNLNLAARLPDFFVKPDLGPKMYNAYGLAKYPQYGTTNLHLDISDAVNVMVYVAKQEELDSYVLKAIYESDSDPEMIRRVTEGGERPGALWHIFDACDADKIRDLLNKVAIERGKNIEQWHDPIHDQDFFLGPDLRKRLREEYNVHAYPIIQCAGDAVFIPAGAPHQVQNLNSCIKVAEDFVSPEHLHHCFKLTQEFRSLSGTHSNHEDKLQVKNIIYHAVKDAVAVLLKHDPVLPSS